MTDWTRLDGVGVDRLWLRPLGLITGRPAANAVAAGYARPLTTSYLAFTSIAAGGLESDRRPVWVTAPVAEIEAAIASSAGRFARRIQAQLAALSTSRLPWAGFALDRPLVMGVL
ncbi:MAG TPA: hypothetical protein VE687_11485, partial [Stellaceae bacterium]|nr:hypothetical protein [Stellaceae bacterium]